MVLQILPAWFLGYHVTMTYPFDMPGKTTGVPDAAKADVLSVTSLNRLARSLLESNFPKVLVEGEISNLATPASGHWYFTLKDDRAQVRCAMFRNRNMSVRDKPENGLQIRLSGKLSIYEGRGDYQLIVDDMEHAGDGALRRAFEQLKARLLEEGLFAPENKKPVTDRFRHIAVISSPTGAVIRDILSVFRRRYPRGKITLIPVPVQGNEASAAIVKAISLANRLADKLALEAILIARGGGSLEDLQAFNEESVARAIFASQLPVVSAVGHEVDFSIADFVADLRAPTPSAGAELLSPDQQEMQQRLQRALVQHQRAMVKMMDFSRQQLHQLQRRLKHPGRKLQDLAQSTDLLEHRLLRSIKAALQLRQSRCRELLRALQGQSPGEKIRHLRARQDSVTARLLRITRQLMKDKSGHLEQLVHSLNAVSPLNVLARGYSITYRDNGEVLRTSDDVKKGDKLHSQLQSGKVTSQVLAIKKDSLSKS